MLQADDAPEEGSDQGMVEPVQENWQPNILQRTYAFRIGHPEIHRMNFEFAL
jgi:hypothetical protein